MVTGTFPRPPSHEIPSFPHSHDLQPTETSLLTMSQPELIRMEDRTVTTDNNRTTETPTTGNKMGFNVNSYATKKTISQGMLDIALLTANASQLKYVLQVGEKHEFYHLMISMISISIILQIAVGIGFLIIGGLSINDSSQQRTANVLNNTLTGGIFFVTVLNVLISAFGMKQSDDQPTMRT